MEKVNGVLASKSLRRSGVVAEKRGRGVVLLCPLEKTLLGPMDPQFDKCHSNLITHSVCVAASCESMDHAFKAIATCTKGF